METILQEGFNGGELAPDFWGNRSLKQYPQSLKTCRNFKIDRAGKLKKCPGTVTVVSPYGYHGLPQNMSTPVSLRMIPFIIDATHSYVIVFSEYQMLFIQDGEYIQANIFAWDGSTNYIQGQTATVGSADQYFYTCTVQNKNIQPEVTTGWQNYWAKYPMGAYAIPSPYSAADAQNIKFRQVNGLLYIVHPDYPPQQIEIITFGTVVKQYIFTCNPIPFVPSQLSQSTKETISGTNGSAIPKKYLITTVNAITGEESFPGDIAAGQTISTIPLVSGTITHNIVTLTTATPHGLSSGATVKFSIPAAYKNFNKIYLPSFNLIGVVSDGTHYTLMPGTSGSTLVFTADNGAVANNLTNLIYIDGPGTNTTVLSACSLQIIFSSTANLITGITNDNPCLITTQADNTSLFVDGDLVTITGTGVPQLDNKPFYIARKSNTTFVLQGIDASEFVIPGSITGSVLPNILKITLNDPISANNPVALVWESKSGSQSFNYIFYNIYRDDGAGFGFIASSYGLSYIDIGTPADVQKDPPGYNAIFQTANNYPSCIEIYQQRLILGNTNNDPLELDASRTGFPNNFTDHQYIQSDDAIVQQSLQTEAGSRIQDFMDFGFLIVFTDQHEIVLRGDSTGTITPEAINATRQLFHGASSLHPLKVNKSVIFVQANTSMIRDLQVQITPYGMTYLAVSNELSFYAKHLIQGYSIVDWDYQKIYDSVIWAVRNDGILVATPYCIEQGIDAAWFRRDTQGKFGNICCAPEDLELSVYVSAYRLLPDGTSGWQVERMSSDNWTDILDSNYLDAATIVDGRSSTIAPNTTITMSGSTWDGTAAIDITDGDGSALSQFNIGDYIFLTGTDGFVVHGKLQSIYGQHLELGTITVQEAVPDGVNSFGTDGTVNANMRNTPIAEWGRAVTQITNIPIGGKVAVVGDGMVMSNPLNLKRGQGFLSVSKTGIVNLPQPAVYIIVGLPYISDIETLDIDNDPKDSLINKKTILKQAVCMVNSTQGYWVGVENPDTNPQAPQNKPGPVQSPNYTYGLIEAKVRDSAGYNEPTDLVTGRVITDFSGEWGYGSRLFLRSIDPIPCNISAIGLGIAIPSMGK